MQLAEQLVSRRSGVETRPIQGGGAVLVDMNTGKCVRLNRVGAEVWALLERPVTVSAVCQRIGDRYRIATSQAQDDVGRLIERLLNEEVVERVVNEPASVPR